MQIPNQQNLPIQHLAAVFGDVTNSYKFYWFLAILDSVALENKSQISINDLLAKMMAEVWYPINYFNLSFGKQDQLFQYAKVLKSEFEVADNTTKQAIEQFIQKKGVNVLKPLGKYVPYRFLTPWFAAELRGMIDAQKNPLIVELSKKASYQSLYYFDNTQNSIIINEFWYDYLQKHYSILQAFTSWHLLKYLQNNNPNVPNISEKLSLPQERKLGGARKFWTLILEKQPIHCVYSNQIITKNDLSIDHFVPWSFVGHDLIWNLLPVTKSVNSSKNNTLPSLSNYLDAFVNLQYNAFINTVEHLPKLSIIDDYVLLFNDEIREIQAMPEQVFKQKISQTITPLVQIAANTGFAANWIYKK